MRTVLNFDNFDNPPLSLDDLIQAEIYNGGFYGTFKSLLAIRQQPENYQKQCISYCYELYCYELSVHSIEITESLTDRLLSRLIEAYYLNYLKLHKLLILTQPLNMYQDYSDLVTTTLYTAKSEMVHRFLKRNSLLNKVPSLFQFLCVKEF